MANVLFVEDSPTWQLLLEAILDTAGHETKYVSTLNSAIELFSAKSRIDVIVFDLNLDDAIDTHSPYAWLDALKDGLVARKIKIPPIIIVTGIIVDKEKIRRCFTEYRGIVFDFFEKEELRTNPERVREFLQSVKLADEFHTQESRLKSFLSILGYSILMAFIVVLIIGVLSFSVNQFSDPKTQQVFLRIGGILIIVFAIFVKMFSQGTKIEEVIESIAKIWRS